MNAPPPPIADLGALALAAVAQHMSGGAVAGWSTEALGPCVAALRRVPRGEDRRLVAVADALTMSDAELAAVALCLAVERDPHAARALAEAQAPLGATRVLVGMAATALAPLGATTVGIAAGAAVASGLLVLGDEAAALPERSLHVPPPLVAALCGTARGFGPVRLDVPPPLPLPRAMRAEARRRAAALAAREAPGLVLRASSPAEALATAALVAGHLGLGLARIDGMPPPSLAPWLIAGAHLPLFAARPGPGERWTLPVLAPYAGPWLVAAGLDGAVDAERPPDEWLLPVPAPAARARLWMVGGLTRADARRAAVTFRQGAGRIAEIAARARLAASRRGAATPGWTDVASAVAGGAGALDAHARRISGQVSDAALIAPDALRGKLCDLLDRARVRSRLARGLGPAVTARYRPGVRALMVGGSGTGKTLAAQWLATRLGLPLYRVDLAALTSKYIGETEKNLSTLFAAAEHADVVLFFDEADALFAARTEISDSNDRFANAQTNYLLQRIEDYDGIVLLASNSRDRFEPAFVRRLDAILEFPMPEAAARRALWCAHLGDGHALGAADLDRLAVTVDLAGGHIRNIVLAAAARAAARGERLGWAHIAHAGQAEYHKLGRAPPELG
jgi:hypothetical protein